MEELIAYQRDAIASKKDTKYFYVSIPYYGHKVFKCNGIVGTQDHKEFYTNLFLNEKEGSTVLITQGFLGDRFNMDGGVYVMEDVAFNQGDIEPFILETHKQGTQNAKTNS